MKIPPVPEGYSVSEGTLHVRYPSHPLQGYQRTRSVEGAINLGAKRLCRDCFPKPTKEKKPRATSLHRPGLSRADGADAVPNPPEGVGASTGDGQTEGVWG